MKCLVKTISVITLAGCLLFGGGIVSAAQAEQSVSTDLNVNISEVIQLSVGNCGTVTARTVQLNNTPGNFSSCKITVNIGTNAPGYKLYINSVDTEEYKVSADGLEETLTNKYFDKVTDGVTNLVKVESETSSSAVIDNTKVIPPFSATTSAPAAMTDSTVSAWGFAIPRNQSTITGFDPTYYTIDNSNTTSTGKYAEVPADKTLIRARTGAVNSQNTDVYFGARVSVAQNAGTYKGVVLFSVVGEAPTEVGPGDNDDGETDKVDGQTITYTTAEAGTGTFEPYQLTYSDTSNGTPEGEGPFGVTSSEVKALSFSDEANTVLSITSGIVLAGALIWLFFVLFRRKYDVLLLEVGPHKRKVAEAIKQYTKLAASDNILFEVFEEMAGKPLLLVEKIPKRRAKKLVEVLEENEAKVKMRVHKKKRRQKK